ncbi:RagB/SusD family nutrient uptake outer membrane protein [Sphingobacterium alkalisoli]|uniref:RagB/SusD family nutrient uptake outer membrane protein n=1 Tax=Sphingobacterium alkalisoli TaxID=1874115 RepID=A0A4U0H1X7_9SPHI|nr:RagB/SusD family nutrient uptake outer membrane protein [Sphingobacterium alkalisoli]TJY64282.1 RagB/SusD family nutrient uptake outer membrane protein [Sphingobacterium alkalisoli]GGH22716.1 hypothetical protein GCM10011418_29460 [Sphingobacterium alkalisoli]
MKKIFITTLFISALVFGGCSKYLETTPDMRAELDTPNKIAELLTSAYPRANYITFTEAASDNAGDKGNIAGTGEPENRDPWMFKDVESRDEDTPTFYWYGAYRAIAAANHALEAIEKLGSPKETLSMKGEALVARAYAHHMLVTLFSRVYNPNTSSTDVGIPYVTEAEKNVLTKYERGTVENVYTLIEKDLQQGIPLLDDSRYKVPKYHFTRAAAHAFAARFYLFKQDYAKVVEHANSSLGQDITSFLRPINSTSFRSMEYYAKQQWYTIAENSTNLLLVEAASAWGRNLAGYRYGLTTPLLSELIYGSNVSGGSYAYMIYGGTEAVYNIPKFKELFVTTSINAEYGDPYNMIPLFTADELLLNRAEAYARLKQYDNAIADLNSFASKKVYTSQNNPIYNPATHNITETKLASFYRANLEDNIISGVLDFRRREFLFEGIRWFDILRHNIVVVHRSHDQKNTYTLGLNDPMRMFQLPEEVILSGVQANPR